MTPDDIVSRIHPHVPRPLAMPADDDNPPRLLASPEGTDQVFVITVHGPYDMSQTDEISELAADLGLAWRWGGPTAEVQPPRAGATAEYHSPTYSLCVPCHTKKEQS